MGLKEMIFGAKKTSKAGIQIGNDFPLGVWLRMQTKNLGNNFVGYSYVDSTAGRSAKGGPMNHHCLREAIEMTVRASGVLKWAQLTQADLRRYRLPARPFWLERYEVGGKPPEVPSGNAEAFFLSEIDMALKHDEDKVRNMGGKAINAEQSQNYRDAVQLYDEALQIFPQRSSMLCNRGKALYRAGRGAKESIKSLEQALKLNQYNTMALHEIGFILREGKKPKKALGYFDKAINIDPDYAYAWFNKGAAYVDLKKFRDALKCYQKCEKLGLPQAAGAIQYCRSKV